MNKNIFIEGEIKSGKTYVLNEVLKRLNIKYGGFITYPFFINGFRVGFKIKDIITSEEEIIAKFNVDGNLIIFPYIFDDFGVKSLDLAYSNCDLIVIDEIGFIEEESMRFKDKLFEILKSDKKFIGTIKSQKTPFLKKVIEYGKVFKVDKNNKDEIIQKILLEVN